jgi:hypothetical protein
MIKFLSTLLLGLLVLMTSVRALDTPTVSGTIQTSDDREVWVNTATGVYHYPGTRWYGSTNSGQFMNEEEAQARGYKPSKKGERTVSRIKSYDQASECKIRTHKAEDARISFGLLDEE